MRALVEGRKWRQDKTGRYKIGRKERERVKQELRNKNDERISGASDGDARMMGVRKEHEAGNWGQEENENKKIKKQKEGKMLGCGV